MPSHWRALASPEPLAALGEKKCIGKCTYVNARGTRFAIRKIHMYSAVREQVRHFGLARRLGVITHEAHGYGVGAEGSGVKGGA